ncbi:Capsular polysaccharide ABC transporter, permease protein KpsM [Lutibaculum baratangense AMV1]|uniref:Capsular polysaccharide ABC transporter, permease protein KpsM n=1 Tax=Lutibaculum baratangense AMV1 TaxID=631454 RepID=V4QU94_9HYPH|nr:Capsular polysaccharide ABC transporter, permease protein KpsM [Lutibaculum baratangense AMV1]
MGYDTLAARLKVQLRVIRALMIRDLMSRYGRRNLGFLWLAGEPLILILGIVALRSMFMGGEKHGISAVTFILTGYSMLTLWRHTAPKGAGGIKAGGGLLFHQNVQVLDMMIAGALTEILGCAMAFIIAYVMLLILGLVPPAEDHFLMVSAWLLFGLLGFGVSLILAAVCEMVEIVEKFVQPLMYLTLPLSGVFTMMAWLPTNIREPFLWIPLPHAVEMFRAGFMGSHHTFFYDPFYLFAWGVGLVILGLLLLRRAERYMQV